MKSKLHHKIFFWFFLISVIYTANISCAKTNDVQPIENNIDTTSTTIADDTVYINSTTSGFILNEVLYDPPSGLAGDANNDGTRDPDQDEFVEFINNSSSCIDISGCKIYDRSNLTSGIPNHQFPNNTFVNPNQSVIVFGGGTAVGQFGGGLVFISSNVVMNLNNGSSNSAGDLMTFTDSLGNILIEFDIDPLSNSPDESYTRSPDITGDFVQHNSVNPGTLFSPGTKTDGSNF
jgi:hypothetical protein